METEVKRVKEAADEVKEVLPEAEPEPAPVKPKVTIRQARLADMPQLEDLLIEFYEIQRRRGNRTLASNPNVLRGGVMVELSMNWANDNCRIMVAERDGVLLGFFIAEIIFCRPIEEYHKCVWVRGDYVKGKSLLNPIILERMWSQIYKWGESQGASYFFGDIHQSNQPSIRTAKSVGFKHYFTRFLKFVSVTEDDNHG